MKQRFISGPLHPWPPVWRFTEGRITYEAWRQAAAQDYESFAIMGDADGNAQLLGMQRWTRCYVVLDAFCDPTLDLRP